mmetsp:Transcript_38833/g.91354  ORF Transcript_38833/g.91354 Transcript_38833/m.91354 type:complete len:246 (-) Transcript_38833:98-835(-)
MHQTGTADELRQTGTADGQQHHPNRVMVDARHQQHQSGTVGGRMHPEPAQLRQLSLVTAVKVGMPVLHGDNGGGLAHPFLPGSTQRRTCAELLETPWRLHQDHRLAKHQEQRRNAQGQLLHRVMQLSLSVASLVSSLWEVLLAEQVSHAWVTLVDCFLCHAHTAAIEQAQAKEKGVCLVVQHGLDYLQGGRACVPLAQVLLLGERPQKYSSARNPRHGAQQGQDTWYSMCQSCRRPSIHSCSCTF